MVAICKEELKIMSNKVTKEIEIIFCEFQEQLKTEQIEL